MVLHGMATRDALDAAFGALADPSRRAIIADLRGGERRVTDLARPFPVSLNAVSKHVKVLERAGLVRRRVLGRDHYISLAAQPLRDASTWLHHYRAFWEPRLEALETLLRDG